MRSVPPTKSMRGMEAVAQPILINVMAIVSLVLSISTLPASVIGCGLLFPIFAVILGLISYAPAKKGTVRAISGSWRYLGQSWASC
jgi:hypothetical protein